MSNSAKTFHPKIRWMRDEAGILRFYKHNHDLYSDELADAADEIIVLKAIVRIKTKSIVAIPVDRALINEPEGEDETLGRLNDEAIHAANLRERETQRARIFGPRERQPLPSDLAITMTIDTGPGESSPDDYPLPKSKIVEAACADLIRPFDEESLQQLLAFISGNGGILGAGIRTYTGRDKNNELLHAGCLELEKRGLIYQHSSADDSILWMPVIGPTTYI